MRVALWLLVMMVAAHAQDGAPRLELGLGVSGVLDEVVLPGPELVVQELDRDAPLVLRIVRVSPHGTAHRYDLEFYGLEAGAYDLTRLLVRADDGASPGQLPPLRVRIVDVLPPGQVQPLGLEAGALPRVGGYRLALVLGAVLWVGGLAALVLAGRRRRAAEEEAVESAPSLAMVLRPLVESARRGDLDSRGQARLERLLLSAWRRKLGLEAVPPAQALGTLREHAEAGALLRNLEAWLHQPPGRADAVDVDALLAPYADLVDGEGAFA